MKFIGKADHIQIVMIGLLAIHGENVKMIDLDRKYGEKK